MHYADIHQIDLKMKGDIIVVYYDGDMVPSSEGVLFGCLNGPKFVKISEEMLLDFMRKAITNRGGYRDLELRTDLLSPWTLRIMNLFF